MKGTRHFMAVDLSATDRWLWVAEGIRALERRLEAEVNMDAIDALRKP